MEILEFGNPENRSLLLLHGLESPWQVWKPVIEAYRERFHILVPILPGHNPDLPEEFESFDHCAQEIEEFYGDRCGRRLYAVCAMSMGGVLAATLWQRGNIRFRKLIFSSSPLECMSPTAIRLMQRQYLALTDRVRKGNERVLHWAVGTMVTEAQLPHFHEILCTITDRTLERYLDAIGSFRYRKNLPAEDMEVYYYHGAKLREYPFRNAAERLLEVCPGAKIVCLKGKGHCEDILFSPGNWVREMDRILEA